MSDGREYSTKEIQNKLLEILAYFDDYAKKNKIRYYLAGGTLLGAVRHGGFIPWDDDVDLMIPRTDYDRLIHSYPNDGQYHLDSCETTPGYGTTFARLWDTHTRLADNENPDLKGLFIDLFPIDGYPQSKLMSKAFAAKLRYKRLLVDLAKRPKIKKPEKYWQLKRLLQMSVRKDANTYAQRHNRYAKKINYDKADYVGVTSTSVHIFRERNNKDIFRSTEYLPFENLSLPAPSGYDTYLKHLYGDYMTLPPVEKRHSTHVFKILKLD